MPFEHSKKRILGELAILLVVLLFLGLGAHAFLRSFSSWGAQRVPLAVEQKLGGLLAEAISIRGSSCTTSGVQRAVEQVTRHLVQTGGIEPSTIEVTVLNNPEANAFALPGGNVFVYSGLLKAVSSVDELAGVLAHELGHVVQRHHVQRALQQLGMSAAFSLLFGEVDVLTGKILGQGSELLDLSFNREQEEDADRYALELASQAGYRPEALGTFLERLDEAQAGPSLLRTHPAGKDRRETLEALAISQQRIQKSQRRAPLTDFDVLKTACE